MVIAKQTIEELGVTDMKRMGQVMGKIIGANKDQVDPGVVKSCLQELLQ